MSKIAERAAKAAGVKGSDISSGRLEQKPERPAPMGDLGAFFALVVVVAAVYVVLLAAGVLPTW